MAKTNRPEAHRVHKIQDEIITARPDGMDYMTYRAIRKEQNKMLRDRIRKGFLVWDSHVLGTLYGSVPKLIFVK